MPNSSIAAFIVSEITALYRTNGQTDMARSNLLVIVIKNIYVYFIGSKTLSFTCYILSDESIIPIIPIIPFTLRVTSIKTSRWPRLLPVTKLKGMREGWRYGFFSNTPGQ